MPNTKPWYDSKTYWINGLTLIAGVVGYFTTSSLFTSQQVTVMVSVLAVINLVLRSITNTGIGMPGPVAPTAVLVSPPVTFSSTPTTMTTVSA